MLVFLDLWWPVGLLLATGLSWVFIGHSVGGADSWRWLFLAASFPAFMTWIVRRTLPESPYYLARTGRRREAAAVLTEITGRPVSEDEVEVPAETRPSSIRELFTRTLARTDALMIGVWVALNISYYGLFLWLPFVLNGDKFTIDLYLLLALSALSQFPGYAAAIWLVGFFNLGAWGALYPYTSELFPTRVRASAFGMLEGVGKAAAIAGPYIFGNLKDATGGTFWPLTFVALVMAGGGVVAAVLGQETRGKKLL
jgi:putative MFS transporter